MRLSPKWVPHSEDNPTKHAGPVYPYIVQLFDHMKKNHLFLFTFAFSRGSQLPLELEWSRSWLAIRRKKPVHAQKKNRILIEILAALYICQWKKFRKWFFSDPHFPKRTESRRSTKHMFHKIRVLKNFSKLIGKHLRWGHRKKRLQHRCFPVKVLRTPFYRTLSVDCFCTTWKWEYKGSFACISVFSS